MKSKFKLEQWKRLVEECETSNMPVRDWCHSRGISFYSYRSAKIALANIVGEDNQEVGEGNMEEAINWEEIVEEIKKSKLSAKDFCSQEGLSYKEYRSYINKRAAINSSTSRGFGQEYWDDIERKITESGLNAKDWCSENNVSYSSLCSRRTKDKYRRQLESSGADSDFPKTEETISVQDISVDRESSVSLLLEENNAKEKSVIQSEKNIYTEDTPVIIESSDIVIKIGNTADKNLIKAILEVLVKRNN